MRFARMLRRGWWSALGVVVLALMGASTASAIQTAVPSSTSPMWQTNGIVYALEASGGRVYAGGTFSTVRPPGAASGTQEVTRTRLAAFDANTGALVTSFNHTLNGNVFAIAASPDGQTIYVGGDFTTVNGQTRNRIAAFNAQTGALTSWSSSVWQRVAAIDVSPTGVYIGGAFTTAGGRSVQRVAMLSPITGQASATFNTAADAYVYSIALSHDFSKLYIAGTFNTLNGDNGYYAAGVVDSATGDTLPFGATSVVTRPSPGCLVHIKVVRTDENGAYWGAEGTGGGCFDGTFGSNHDGSLKWVSRCLGATQAIQPLKDELFTGAHAHDCAADQPEDPDAFPETGWARGLSRHFLSRSLATGHMGNWYPTANGGIGEGLGPRVMATDGTQLFVGGEFTSINGSPQQSLARFNPAAGDQAVPSQPVAPTAVARGDGKVSVFVQAPLDSDDPDLTVRLFRGNDTTPIATKQVRSLFWRRPIVAFVDNDRPIGSNQTYRADAVETNGPNAGQRSALSNTVTVVANAPTYAQAVLSQNPKIFWRFDDVRAPAIADSADSLQGGTSWLGMTFQRPGANDNGSSIGFNGSTGSIATTDVLPTPGTYSINAWFRTTSTAGGKIVGFGNVKQGYDFNGNPTLSSNYDKHIYMTNNGRLVFGVYNGGTDVLTTAASYNDGEWHQVTATQGPNGMTLYVDGVRVGRNGVTTSQGYNGHWRVGGDNLNGWPNRPTSNYFAGDIDDVSIYDSVLTAQQVAAQHVASGRTPDLPPAPTDDYGKAVYDDEPSAFWRLDETSGNVANDSSGNQNPAGYVAGVTQGGPSGIGTQGTSATFNGSNGNVAQSNGQGSPARYSHELWFRTTTTTGGKIVGFGNAQTGNSSNYDKHVYMTNSGQLIFGVWNNSPNTVTSPASYNDGQWHYLVTTQGADGMRMYVDGELVGSNGVSANQGYNGFWRVGGDNLGAWPSRPSTDYFAGTIDEVAIYDFALSAEQVSAHYAAAGHTGPDIVAPTASITAPANGATVETGPVTVTADANDNVGVTSVELQVGGTTVGTATEAPYSFTWNATDGAHTLRVIARDAAGNTGTSDEITVTAVTPDTTAPTTAITSPANGATVWGSTSVTATADDNVGVESVQLRVDGAVVATDTSAPYEFTWDATDAGERVLTTVATDAAGNTGTSGPITVTVQAPPDTTAPTTAITSPAHGATVWGSTSVTATADDNVGVESVQLRVDGAVVATDTSAPYEFTWNATEVGERILTTVATDAAGNTGTSDPIVVNVEEPQDTTPPSAPGTLTGIASGETSVQLNWGAATDNVGVTGYIVVRDGTDLPGVVTGLEYEDTSLASDASYTYAVHAVDAAGNRGAASNTVTVALTTGPTVLFNETFSGVNGSPWSPSSWTTSVSGGSVLTQGQAGVMTHQDAQYNYARAQLTGLAATTDSEVLTSFQWNAATPVSYFSVYLRGSGGWQNGYRPRTGIGIQIQSNSASVRVHRNVNGVMTDLGGFAGVQQVTTSKQWLRLRVTGNTVQFKIWTDGQAEPAQWEGQITDNAVSGPGQLHLSLNRGGSNVGAKSVTLDDLTVFQG